MSENLERSNEIFPEHQKLFINSWKAVERAFGYSSITIKIIWKHELSKQNRYSDKTRNSHS